MARKPTNQQNLGLRNTRGQFFPYTNQPGELLNRYQGNIPSAPGSQYNPGWVQPNLFDKGTSQPAPQPVPQPPPRPAPSPPMPPPRPSVPNVRGALPGIAALIGAYLELAKAAPEERAPFNTHGEGYVEYNPAPSLQPEDYARAEAAMRDQQAQNEMLGKMAMQNAQVQAYQFNPNPMKKFLSGY